MVFNHILYFSDRFPSFSILSLFLERLDLPYGRPSTTYSHVRCKKVLQTRRRLLGSCFEHEWSPPCGLLFCDTRARTRNDRFRLRVFVNRDGTGGVLHRGRSGHHGLHRGGLAASYQGGGRARSRRKVNFGRAWAGYGCRKCFESAVKREIRRSVNSWKNTSVVLFKCNQNSFVLRRLCLKRTGTPGDHPFPAQSHSRAMIW